MIGKVFRFCRFCAVPCLVAFATSFSGSSSAQVTTTTDGTLTLATSGVRWGIDPFGTYSYSGSCTGTTVDFHVGYQGSLPYVNVATPSSSGYAFTDHPGSVPCVSGGFQVAIDVSGNWRALLPGNYSLHGVRSLQTSATSTQVYVTPDVAANVHFDHPFFIREIDSGVTPAHRGNATFLDPRLPAPVPRPPGMTSPQMIKITGTNLVGMTLPVAANDGVVWVYDGVLTPVQSWRALKNNVGPMTLLSGNTAIAEIFPDATSTAYIAFSYAAHDLAPLPPMPQPVTPQADMWWGGADESGWGLSVGRNGDALFVAGYLYDYGGKPMWAVMQNGAWDSTHTLWTADVYIPHGTPFDHYDATRLDTGTPAGKATLQFTGPATATFRYLNGYPRSVSRYAFDPGGNGPYHGYWFGGAAQNGWGLHVAQQGDTIFATWYTYGADGTPTWFFMPGATKLSATHFNGALYRTTGGSWPTMEHYDPSATKVSPAGTLDLAFTSDSAGTMTAVIDGKTISNPIQRFGF